MANGGGSINLRMSLKGAEQVKAELAAIGPAGAKMARELDRAVRTPAPGLKALDTGAKEVRGGFEGLAGRLGPLGSGLSSLGGIGLGVAAALAAVAAGAAMALNQARAAAEWADEIEDSAAKINIGVEALQEWRYAAQEAGGEAQDADSAIDSFQKKLGEGLAGGRSIKWFERLGFGKEDLKNFASTEAALDAVIDKIAGLGTEAERAAVAEKLGLGPLIPLVREGSDAIAQMRQEARDLGVVMEEEMITRGAETAREMERLSQVIDMQMKQAFVDLGPVIIWVMGLVGQLASALNNLSNSWKAFEQKSTDYLQREDQRLARGITSLMTRSGANSPDELSPSERTLFNRMNERRGRIATEIGDRAAERAATPDPAPVPTTTLVDVSGGGRRRGGGGRTSDAEREAQRREQEAERALERLSNDELRARRDHIRSVLGNADTAAARAAVDLALLDIDEQERSTAVKELADKIRAGGLMTAEVQARLDLLDDLAADVRAVEERRIADEQALAEREALRAAEDEYASITADILSVASAGARTAAERQAIELELLDLAQRRQRADLQAAIEAEREPGARQRLVDALERLPELHAAQRREVSRQTSGPLGAWRDDQFQSWGEVSEHLQGEALSALDGLNDGLRDAWKNAESASDAFKAMGDVAVDALGRVVDALLEVAIQKMLIEPLVNGIFGAPGQSGGGLLGSFLNNLGGSFMGAPGKTGNNLTKVVGGKGFARGGLVGATGLYPVGEESMELVELPGGSRVHDAHRTAAIMAGMEGGQRGGSAGAVVNMPVTIINNASDQVSARAQQTPKGLDLFVEPLVRQAVGKMGADGSLARAHAMTPRPIKRG